MFHKNTLKFQNRVFLGCICKRNSHEYQYIQNSKIPTFHFQKSLPRLPIPELEKTCDRFLAALKPLLTDCEFKETEKLIQHFNRNEGKRLHEELVKNDILNQHTSYISKPWFDMYLSDRSPLPLNYNPVLVYNKSKHPDNDNQVIKASNLLISSLRFLKSLRKNILYPDVYHLNPKNDTDVFRTVTRFLPSSVSWYGAYLFKAFPLDMSQYSNLFNSTRIPKKEKDILYKDESGKHILVLRRGHFFSFDVLDENGNIRPPEDIFMCLKHIAEKDLKLNTKSVGLLTTENRDVWAECREYMSNSSQENFDSFKAIDSALFCLCLDDEEMNSDPLKIMKNFLHGNGYNRWFDKSFSLLVSKDGVAGVNFEHSWGDGVAVLRYFQDIYKDTNEHLFVHSNTAKSNSQNLVKELHFNIDEKSAASIHLAEEKFKNVCKSVTFNAVECHKLGKNNCKSAQISPDSVMQLAFQVAYHKAYEDFTATYESCSTAAFKHGRTETVRPCTNATKAFALSINGKNRPSRSELIDMMKTCSSVHGRLTKEAAMGQGFDRHLFGLKDMAIRAGFRIPDFFSDTAYKKINYNILSTSTLASSAVLIGGFGPVVPDGLGVGYSIANDYCGSVVSSYHSCRNGEQFADALLMVFNDFADILSSKKA